MKKRTWLGCVAVDIECLLQIIQNIEQFCYALLLCQTRQKWKNDSFQSSTGAHRILCFYICLILKIRTRSVITICANTAIWPSPSQIEPLATRTASKAIIRVVLNTLTRSIVILTVNADTDADIDADLNKFGKLSLVVNIWFDDLM